MMFSKVIAQHSKTACGFRSYVVSLFHYNKILVILFLNKNKAGSPQLPALVES